jgi:hypothetical protein
LPEVMAVAVVAAMEEAVAAMEEAVEVMGEEAVAAAFPADIPAAAFPAATADIPAPA